MKVYTKRSEPVKPDIVIELSHEEARIVARLAGGIVGENDCRRSMSKLFRALKDKGVDPCPQHLVASIAFELPCDGKGF